MKAIIRKQLNQCIDDTFIKVQKSMEELRDTLHEITSFMTSDFDKYFEGKARTDIWDEMIYRVEVQHLAIFGTVLANFKSYLNKFGHDFNFDFDLRSLYKTVELEEAIVRKSFMQKKMKDVKEELKKSLRVAKSKKMTKDQGKSLFPQIQEASYNDEFKRAIVKKVPTNSYEENVERKSYTPKIQEEEKPSCFGVSCNNRIRCGICPPDIFEKCFNICKENEEKKKKPKKVERTVERSEL